MSVFLSKIKALRDLSGLGFRRWFSSQQPVDLKHNLCSTRAPFGARTLVRGVLILGLLGATSRPAKAIEVGDFLPALKMAAMKGEPFTTGRTKGKVTVVNFWATWCEACKTELVEMEEQFKIFRHDRDIQLVFVNLDKDPRQAVAWARQTLKNPLLFLESNYLDGSFEVADQLRVDAFPMTLVIDRQGKIAYKQKGFNPGEKMTEKLVHEIKARLRPTG